MPVWKNGDIKKTMLILSQVMDKQFIMLQNFYTAEKNWKVVYTTRSMFSKLATEWEHWEPEDKTWKDPIRTHWLGDDEIFDLETQRAKKRGEEKEWWDKEGEDGYTSELENIDWDWDDTVRGKGEEKQMMITLVKRAETKGHRMKLIRLTT